MTRRLMTGKRAILSFHSLSYGFMSLYPSGRLLHVLTLSYGWSLYGLYLLMALPYIASCNLIDVNLFYELYLSSSLGCSFTINGQRLYAASSLKVMKISNRCCWLYLTGLNFLSSWPLLFGIFVKAITRRPNVRMMLAWKRLSAVERELRLTTDHVTGPEKRKERLDHK